MTSRLIWNAVSVMESIKHKKNVQKGLERQERHSGEELAGLELRIMLS